MSLKSILRKELSLNATTGFVLKPAHHLIFWAVYFVINFLRWGSYYDDYILSLQGNLLGFPIHMFLSYFTVYFLLPKFIYRRKFISFSLILAGAIFIMVVVKFYLTSILINQNVWPEGPVETSSLSLNYVINMMLGELYVISFAAAIYLTIHWMQETNRLATLEKAKLETELRFLRGQISPHFFFNTLNNIYSLTLENSKKASDIILKLSEVMRYLLYDTRENKQSLSKEIMCLQNYLELERIRHGNSLTIKMEISGELEGKLIAPMLLLPFLENAFKHGANKKIGKVEINMQIKIVDDFMFFRLTNTLPDVSENSILPEHSGIGIANVKKRLELGYEMEDYCLKNYREEKNYVVELKLRLK